jgi:K(+)-stimulated pyrophosphate-energized sodium pump
MYSVPVCGILALGFAWIRSSWIQRQDAGDAKMQSIALHIREGAMAFLGREYRVLAIFVVVAAGLLAWVNAGQQNSSALIGVSLIAGAFCSALAGFFGMRVATAANVRTAAAARGSLNRALQVAFSGGAVMGFSVVGLGVLGLGVLFLVYTSIFTQGGSQDNLRTVVTVLTQGRGRRRRLGWEGGSWNP